MIRICVINHTINHYIYNWSPRNAKNKRIAMFGKTFFIQHVTTTVWTFWLRANQVLSWILNMIGIQQHPSTLIVVRQQPPKNSPKKKSRKGIHFLDPGFQTKKGKTSKDPKIQICTLTEIQNSARWWRCNIYWSCTGFKEFAFWPCFTKNLKRTWNYWICWFGEI